MSYAGRESSKGFDLLTGGLVGAIGAMLSKTSPSQSVIPATVHPVPPGIPPEVVVVNKPEDPVPTTETKT